MQLYQSPKNVPQVFMPTRSAAKAGIPDLGLLQTPVMEQPLHKIETSLRFRQVVMLERHPTDHPHHNQQPAPVPLIPVWMMISIFLIHQIQQKQSEAAI